MNIGRSGMRSEESDKMRAEAHRCRLLAGHMHTKSTREMLERVAADYEKEAERIERSQDG